MANVLVQGTQPEHNFTFVGINQLIIKAKAMRTYYENTTLDATTFSSFNSETASYLALTSQMQDNMDKVYFDTSTFPYVQIPDVNSSSVFLADYLKVEIFKK
jgi:hypothetical protein